MIIKNCKLCTWYEEPWGCPECIVDNVCVNFESDSDDENDYIRNFDIYLEEAKKRF